MKVVDNWKREEVRINKKITDLFDDYMNTPNAQERHEIASESQKLHGKANEIRRIINSTGG